MVLLILRLVILTLQVGIKWKWNHGQYNEQSYLVSFPINKMSFEDREIGAKNL